MKKYGTHIGMALVVIFTTIFAASPVLAHNQPWAKEHYRNDHPQRVPPQHNEYRRPDHRRPYFTDKHRVVLHKYYTEQYRHHHYPAQRYQHYMPGHHARKWVVGRPLPREVVFHDLPPKVLVELGPAPPHHRFVRVAQDILLLATGTGMVVDAIDHLNWELAR